jgi:hypothetical protein
MLLAYISPFVDYQTSIYFGLGFQTSYLAVTYFDRFSLRRIIDVRNISSKQNTKNIYFSPSTSSKNILISVTLIRKKNHGQRGCYQSHVCLWQPKWRNTEHHHYQSTQAMDANLVPIQSNGWNFLF